MESQREFGGRFIGTNPNSQDKKGGVGQWVLSPEFKEHVKIMGAWSACYLHTIIKIDKATLHIFTVYVPPGFTITEIFDILRNLFWAVDNEIRVAKGLNYYCIAGDLARVACPTWMTLQSKGSLRD